MDRPLVARLARPFALPLPGLAPRTPPRRARPKLRGDLLRAPLDAIRDRRRVRIALLCAVVCVPLLAVGYLWFRGSSFVRVEHVAITGVSGPQAGAIESALTGAAHGMSTLEVSTAGLQSSVRAYPSVAAVHVAPSFPHSVRIEVVQRSAVAALVVGGVRTAVSSDGIALGAGLLSDSLPTVAAVHEPMTGARVGGTQQLAELALLGAAPPALARHVQSVFTGRRGLTVTMKNGLLVYFGDATRPHAKWLSLARVLADSSSAGASYVDVRTPSRPAAGFPEGSAPSYPAAGAAQGEGEVPTTGESPVGALAAGLAAANPSTRTTTESESESSTGEGSGEHESSTTGEASKSESEGSSEGSTETTH
jgi:cell division protein FtsQ